MKKFFKRMFKRYENHALHQGRVKVREVLLRYDDRYLDDMGISRHLLVKGVQAWPWQEDRDLQPAPSENRTLIAEEQKAIRELQRCSDAELRDIGITRGTIRQAVRFGRQGADADYQAEGKAA